MNVQGADKLQAQAGNNTSFHAGEGMCQIIRGRSNGKGGFNFIATGDVFNTGLKDKEL